MVNNHLNSLILKNLSLPDLAGGSPTIWIPGVRRMRSNLKMSKANVMRVKDCVVCVKLILT